jgi:DNA-binding NtrC family response regulator
MPKNILIIDDEEIVTKSLRKLLKKQGYGVTVAQSGQQALQEVKNQDFHLVVCDVRMPQMDGIETIKEIRRFLKNEGKAPIPEILITGYADEEKYKNAVNLKVADYIYKPFDMNDFLEVVKRNLEPR